MVTSTSSPQQPDQLYRRISLILLRALPVTVGSQVPAPAFVNGLDLSEFRIRFQVRAPDVQTPNTATIRIYNLSDGTAKQIQGEYTQVILQAGYQDSPNYGVIFNGTIKQTEKGRESNVDSYVELRCSDGDLLHNWAAVNTTLPPNATQQQQLAAMAVAAARYGATLSPAAAITTGGILPRGKVLFGLWRSSARDFSNTTGIQLIVQNGVVTPVPLTGYAPGTAVKLSSKTGLIGVPQATDNGVMVRCLLNPLINLGGLVQIDNTDINSVTINEQGFPDYTSINLPAAVTEDGFYKVLVREFIGDTRGQDWYSDLTCISVDPSAAAGNSVKPFLASGAPS